jgi:hypothetical protein
MIFGLLIWAGLGAHLLFETYRCNVPIGPERPIWPHLLSCVAPNEMGDILAGFFAPAAFFVLTGAVFLQSLELKAQRDELAETRAVFEEQNRLVAAQTRAAEASAAVFATQNTILRRQEERLAAKALEDECDIAISQLVFHLRTALGGHHWLLSMAEGRHYPFGFNRGVSEEEPGMYLSSFYDAAAFDHITRGIPRPYGVAREFTGDVVRAAELTKRVLDLAAKCGPDRKAMIETANIARLYALFEVLLNATSRNIENRAS